METLITEQTICPSKQIKNPKRKTHPHYLHNQVARQPNISRQSSNVINHNFAPFINEYDMMMMYGGVGFNNHPNTPFHMSSSLPPYFHQQPPLLPLPVAPQSPFQTLSGLGRSQSLSPQVPTKRTYKKSSLQKPKKENKNNNNDNKNNNSRRAEGIKQMTKDDSENDDSVIVGPDPGSLPKDVTRILMGDVESVVEMEKFSGSIFSMAPPPSSLPLPKFSLRQPKLSCTAEAAVAAAIEVDSGATDSLRRMLKLR